MFPKQTKKIKNHVFTFLNFSFPFLFPSNLATNIVFLWTPFTMYVAQKIKTLEDGNVVLILKRMMRKS